MATNPEYLEKNYTSLCPDCLKNIDAYFSYEGNLVFLNKTCLEHGNFKDLFYSSRDLFEKSLKFYPWMEPGKINPACPEECGLCSFHKSAASIINIDLTSDCNLKCPFCFASSNEGEKKYLTPEKIKFMLKSIKPNRGQRAVLQISGGEPTISPHFFEAISIARELGFYWIQAVTNGIKFGKSREFTRKAKEAGLKGLYMQFDGVEDEVWKKTRGKPLMDMKIAAIENCRREGLRVILVVTLIKGINGDQVGKILNFALENIDTVVGISFQPLSFTGRVPFDERMEKRYTLSHLAEDLEKTTDGKLKAMRDFYPLSSIVPISKLINLTRKTPFEPKVMECTCHPLCGLGTYLLVEEKTKNFIPLPEMFDWDGILSELHYKVEEEKKKYGHWKIKGAFTFGKLLFKYRYKNSPVSAFELLKIFDGLTGSKSFGIARKNRYPWRLFLAAGMHFMDNYNFLKERIQRCVVHYVGEDGRAYPFCSYNAGPTFRNKFEGK